MSRVQDGGTVSPIPWERAGGNSPSTVEIVQPLPQIHACPKSSIPPILAGCTSLPHQNGFKSHDTVRHAPSSLLPVKSPSPRTSVLHSLSSFLPTVFATSYSSSASWSSWRQLLHANVNDFSRSISVIETTFTKTQ